jgi:uncharacterized circularly permuted ATP-grasp superfamily protein/uncharacterized alpha-E superfamily protein
MAARVEPVRDEPARKPERGRLTAGYRASGAVPDELVGAGGDIRPVWRGFVAALEAMEPEELTARIARGDQYLRDAGVFYRQYGQSEAAERDWPLSHIPVLIGEAEWAGIEAGLMQRADLLEAVVADVYGPNRLVVDGHLPPAIIAQNQEWLRPLVGVAPRSGHFLHFLAFDIGRGPTGEWWVLGDRTQAPSGAGFALENRIATARVYADLYGRSNVHRLAGFFRAFRDTLQDLREGDDSRIGILTPGPMNDTYFEHAYIARYLGFMLLEGEDLTVRDGQLMVRTVGGLKPVSVLWRRLDAAWADPLELNEGSRLGTPGLLGAVRAGNLTMVNALGSGVIEARAFLAFLPRICEALLGEPLKLPNVATWWCGQAAERDYVKANAGRMTIGKAFSTRLLFDPDDVSAIGGAFNRSMRETVEAWIEHGAGQLVGQEAVSLSTTPALVEGRLAPRPMSLRVFLARTGAGWKVMPGGFARIGRSGHSSVLALQQGGSAADVWIVSDRPVPPDTMQAPASQAFTRQAPGVLPSRAADNLFWLGRYVERTETLVRLLRAHHVRVAESAVAETPLLALSADYLKQVGVDVGETMPPALPAALASATASAGHVRDRFSSDGWMALADLSKTVRGMRDTVKPGDDMARAMSVLLRKLSGFSGLVHENMYHFSGWRFLTIGRSLERALSTAFLLAAFADEEAPDGSLDLAVEVGDSVMSHRRRYAVSTNRATVVDLLALDALNPRSVVFQLGEIMGHLEYLPGQEPHQPLTPLRRAMLKAKSGLELHLPETLDTKALTALGGEIADLSTHLAATYLR